MFAFAAVTDPQSDGSKEAFQLSPSRGFVMAGGFWPSPSLPSPALLPSSPQVLGVGLPKMVFLGD